VALNDPNGDCPSCGNDGYDHAYNDVYMESDRFTSQKLSDVNAHLSGRYQSGSSRQAFWTGFSYEESILAKAVSLTLDGLSDTDLARLANALEYGSVDFGTDGTLDITTIAIGADGGPGQSTNYSLQLQAQNGGALQAGMSDDFLTSVQLAIAALEPSFRAAASQAKHGGSVPLFIKKNIFKSATAVNNNAVRLGKVSSSFARNGAAILKVAAPALTVTAVLTNGYSIFSDGQLTWGDAFVGVNTTLQIAFPIYGVAYGLVDVGTSFVTGTSLTDKIKNGIDSNTSGSISVSW
jgi:hypothetical protein